MYNSLATLRALQSEVPKPLPSQPQGPKSVPPSPVPLENFSARRATWLFVHQPEKLDEAQRQELALMRQASPSASAPDFCVRSLSLIRIDNVFSEVLVSFSLTSSSLRKNLIMTQEPVEDGHSR
jgi:hypothetical protein